jgi:hypothetical protein
MIIIRNHLKILESIRSKLKKIGHGGSSNIRHNISEIGSTSPEKIFRDLHSTPPYYSEFVKLKKMSNTMFGIKNYHTDQYSKLFPTLSGLALPPDIKKFRQDYIKFDKHDLAEVLYVFGDDIIVYYDFDESRWFILDTTTSKQSEYKNVPFSALADLFNEDKDPLLKKILAELEKKNPEEAKNIREKNSALEEILIKLAKQYE